MQILHVLSSAFVTGSEKYAITLANYHIQEGHQVFVVGDALCTETSATYYSANIHNRSYLQRYRNIQFIRKVIRKHKIDVVHAHSRAASWVSYFAVKGTKVALISTIHGRQALHASTSAFDIYGNKVIAVCDNLKLHLVQEVKMKEEKIEVIPNVINFHEEEVSVKHRIPEADQFVLNIIGRTGGPKGKNTEEILKTVLPDLIKEFPFLKIKVVGGDPFKDFAPDTLETVGTLNIRYANAIDLIPYKTNIDEYLLNADAVIGAGRVAMEALYNATPVIAFGEAFYHGIINQDNLEEVVASNFGDVNAASGTAEINFNQIKRDLFLLIENRHETRQKAVSPVWIKDKFNVEKNAGEIMNVYRQALLQLRYRKWIPALMYHSIPGRELDSIHKIFVTKKKFEKHLRFFKRRGLTAITFSEYHEFATGSKSYEYFPEKPIFITFDDGYLDNYTNALPLLKKYRFKAIIYTLAEDSITDNSWDTKHGEIAMMLMNTDQKKEMIKEGIEFGSHSLTHADLTAVTAERAKHEIMYSKIKLEEDLKVPILSFAYPYGRCNEAIKLFANEAGYHYAVSTSSGAERIEDDNFQIYRINIFPNENLFSLYKKTSSWYRSYVKKKYKR